MISLLWNAMEDHNSIKTFFQTVFHWYSSVQLFWEILQNSEKDIYDGSLSLYSYSPKRSNLQDFHHKRFPVNSLRYLRSVLTQKTPGWLLVFWSFTWNYFNMLFIFVFEFIYNSSDNKTMMVQCWIFTNHKNFSDYRRRSIKIGVLKNLTKFIGKHLYRSLCYGSYLTHSCIRLKMTKHTLKILMYSQRLCQQ